MTQDSELKLLRCPFCGGPPIFENTITEAIMRCNSCLVIMKERHRGFGYTDQVAIQIVKERWNTRPTPDLKPVRLLDADLVLQHLEVEQAKLIQLYPKSEYGIKKLASRLRLFIHEGEFDAPTPLLAYKERLREWVEKYYSPTCGCRECDLRLMLLKTIESGELEK